LITLNKNTLYLLIRYIFNKN